MIDRRTSAADGAVADGGDGGDDDAAGFFGLGAFSSLTATAVALLSIFRKAVMWVSRTCFTPENVADEQCSRNIYSKKREES